MNGPRRGGDEGKERRYEASSADATRADALDDTIANAFGTGAAPVGGGFLSGTGCPDREQLELLALEAPGTDAIEEHVARCTVCREVVRKLKSDNELLRDFVDANRDRFQRGAGGGGGSATGGTGGLGGTGPMDGGSNDVVPGFRVEGEIHRGAQGVVYRAEQMSTRRKVALKTLLQGQFATTRQRARFDREVEVVASLRHPNIVTLFESGRTSTGLAFFAMELVNGRPLSDVLKSDDRPPLDSLLRTFLAIAKAIAYAHQRGVIHRDLKPANILIDGDGEPHVLDFGLARTARGDEGEDMIEATAAGEFLGTFAYAAPEQLRGNPDLIDVRTDVFALGVILYEMLAGERPYKPPSGSFSIADLLLARIEREPSPPSSIRPCDADLDVIALTCLKSRPEERYQSAQALADDLERWLDGRPILARPDSIFYVARKWVLRHRVATATAAMFVAMLVGGTIGLAILYGVAETERARAERTLASFRDTFQSINPEIGQGKIDMRVGDFLDLIEEDAKRRSDMDPVVADNLLNTVEAIRLGFERSQRPIERLQMVLDRCIASARERGLDDTPEIAEALHNLARGYLFHRRLADAEATYRASLAMRERVHGKDPPEAGLTMQHLASCLREQKKFEEAALWFERALRVQEKAHGRESSEVAAVLNGQARLREDQNDPVGALALYERALDRVRRATAADDFRVGRGHLNVGRSKRKLGRADAAIPDLRMALSIIRLRKGELSRDTIEAQCEYALAVADASGEPTDAIAEVRAVRALLPLPEVEATWNIPVVEELLGRLLILAGDRSGARDAFANAIEAANTRGGRPSAEEIATRAVERLSTVGWNDEASSLPVPRPPGARDER
jgi:serine/threonine-protein kinase